MGMPLAGPLRTSRSETRFEATELRKCPIVERRCPGPGLGVREAQSELVFTPPIIERSNHSRFRSIASVGIFGSGFSRKAVAVGRNGSPPPANVARRHWPSAAHYAGR